MQNRSEKLEWAKNLASLSIPQALAVVPLVTERTGRQVLRDVLIGNLRAQFPTRGTAKADARRLHERLTAPGKGAHADVLRTVNALSRGGVALSADRIEKVLAKLDGIELHKAT
jgi:hypothetical protein